MPKITIIIPVYNVENYLLRCIESVLLQTYTDYELILINDGSDDSCAEIMEQYAKKDGRIVTLHQTNQGLSATRNVGIEIAKGEYITFVDSDDYIFPNYLEKLLNALTRNDADVSVCGIIEFVDKNELQETKNYEEERVYSGIEACAQIYDDVGTTARYVIACAKLYKKELFEKNRYPEGKIHEDQFLTYKILYNCSKVVEIGDCLYGYYQNMQGITKSPFNIKRYDNIEALEEAERFFRDNKENDLMEKVKAKKTMLLIEYSINARKVGIYSKVPSKFKINFLKMREELIKLRGIDSYEYYMYSHYPKVIILESFVRKIFKIKNRRNIL